MRKWKYTRTRSERLEWLILAACLIGCAGVVALAWAREDGAATLCAVEIVQGHSTYVMAGRPEQRGDAWVCKVRR
jgi:hypothetical protein